MWTPYLSAAARIRCQARSRSSSVTPSTWSNRAIAFRTCASAADLLLDGNAARAAAGYPAAVPLLRRAIAMLRAADLSPQEDLRRLGLGCNSAADLDDQAQHALATRWVQLARDHGVLTALPAALNFQLLAVGGGMDSRDSTVL
jgi:hypothetical protein